MEGVPLGFVQNFDARNGRVIRDGFKVWFNFPCALLQIMKGVCELVESSLLRKYRNYRAAFAVAYHLENPFSNAAVPGAPVPK